MATLFMPPANLKDFDRSATLKDRLYQDWHDYIQALITYTGQDWPLTPAFFDPFKPPVAQTPDVAAPAWPGLPGVALRLNRMNVMQAAKLVEDPIELGAADPILEKTPPLIDAQNQVFTGLQYRPQDEYLEWVSIKDAQGIITEVIFTCEGPEYWQKIAEDQDLLLTLYQELLPDHLRNDPHNQVKKDDLVFPRDVWWGGPKPGQPPDFKAGDYNPYNKWNSSGCIHLTQQNNTLGAEINLARRASLLYPAKLDPDLICCARYGEVNRNSDPTIGAAVNAQVVAGNFVSLRNPVGLYMKSLDSSQFTLPNGDPIESFGNYFVPLRQSENREMIVRARFKVPDGVTFNGKQLRVGDLLANGTQIVTGGQIANAITMQLFALTLPGAPSQQLQACAGKACSDPNHPGFILEVDINKPCPPDHPAFEALLARKQTVSYPAAPQRRLSGKYLMSRGSFQP